MKQADIQDLDRAAEGSTWKPLRPRLRRGKSNNPSYNEKYAHDHVHESHGSNRRHVRECKALWFDSATFLVDPRPGARRVVDVSEDVQPEQEQAKACTTNSNS